MIEPKKLIEVAMPIKEISAESVRDKSIRHGHISTLHLWWARRPLPVCRAVVFASLTPDPLDEHCPQPFRDAIADLLGPKNNPGDPYKPYRDIPYTSAMDPMEDNLRNRLLMFIGKFSDVYIKNEQTGKCTVSKEQLSDSSLIKWESKNNEKIIAKARKLIWVAHNCEQAAKAGRPVPDYKPLAAEFDAADKAIKDAEVKLYVLTDRHLAGEESKQRESELARAIDAFQERMPIVFDPFAGGGAIPLEASRLGCRTFANDLNPVAHIIEKGSLEFPQKYGKPITYSKAEFTKRYGDRAFMQLDPVQIEGDLVHIRNRLAFDVEFYAKKLLACAEEEIGHLYPQDEEGHKPVAYYWSRVATCANPTCGAKIPLLKQFYLVNKSDKKIYLNPIVNGKSIRFEIKTGTCESEGWNNRGNLKCPCCGNPTDVKKIKEQSVNGALEDRLLAVIYESDQGKEYRLPRPEEILVLEKISSDIEKHRPTESMQRNSAGGDTFTWGVTRWGQMFSRRQLLVMQTLLIKLHVIKNDIEATNMEYKFAMLMYLGILIDRLAPVYTSFGRWDVTRENIQSPFSRQAIPFIFDYPESNPFCASSGSVVNQLEWITRYIVSESGSPFHCITHNASSGDVEQFTVKSLHAVVTDPPYYDAIAYADLSDFFYVWMKRTLGDVFPLTFAYPQTPKADECTALKHHHANSYDEAKQHFENKLVQIFSVIEHQTDGLVSIMFAHQSTEAWTTLCNSILGAGMNITGSWAIDTELGNRMVAMGNAALASSVTVACRPTQRSGVGAFRTVRSAIENKVREEVKYLYELGFRGADLLTACFGQAVSVFGQYEQVEKADGSQVTVAELLEMAREAAFNAIISDIDADDVTRFYIGWLNLFGFSPADHDDVNRIIVVGLDIDANDLLSRHILLRQANKESLATSGQRIKAVPHLGEKADAFLIDKAHRAMHLYGGNDRRALLAYIGEHASSSQHVIWRVLNSLLELLTDGEDIKAVKGLLADKENLLREAKRTVDTANKQIGLDFSS